MIDRWIPILGRWHTAMRLNYPKFWHLQTVYVGAFFVVATVVVAILAIFIPEQPDNITRIEPGFFLVLAACIAVAANWIRNFLRPLTWKQISNNNAAPGLMIAVLHGAALLAPAFLYGYTLEYRVGRSMFSSDINIKLLLLEAYRDAAADLNLATLLSNKENIPAEDWESIWRNAPDQYRNPVGHLGKYANNNLIPYISKQEPIIYRHYYPAYELSAEVDDKVSLFTDLNIQDNDSVFTKDMAWECMLWHGLFSAILYKYLVIGKNNIDSSEMKSIILDKKIDKAINILDLHDSKDDVLELIKDYSITVEGKITTSAYQMESGQRILAFSGVGKLVKRGGVLSCNQVTSTQYRSNIVLNRNGNINLGEKSLYKFLQFNKKTIIMHGDRSFFEINSAPLRGWPLVTADITKKSTILKGDQVIIERAIKNLTDAKYIIEGDKVNNYYYSFPWLKNWYWFGSKWGFFICIFLLSTLLIGCLVSREVEPEEMAIAAMICALIIGIYVALLGAFGDEYFFYLLQWAFVGLFCLMLSVLIAAIYCQRIGVWWRAIMSATGLTLPFTTLSVMEFVTRGCNDFACGSRPDIRLPILAAGCVVLLVVGEAYLFLLRRAAIKPR